MNNRPPEMTALSERPVYRLRPIRFIDIWHVGDWRFKAYGINASPVAPGEVIVPTEMIDAAKTKVWQIAAGIDAGGSPLAGFVTLHHGTLARWMLIDFWTDWVLMRHFLFRAAHSSPDSYEMVNDGLCACTWELRVTAFERDAWVTHVLNSPGQPDVAAYLDAQLVIDC